MSAPSARSLAGIGICIACTLICLGRAQADGVLPQIIASQVDAVAKVTADPALALHLLPKPLPIPNWQESDVAFAKSLAVFDQIPSGDGATTIRATSISDVLGSVATDVEIGARITSVSDESQRKAAENLLYSNIESKTPSAAYAKYTSFRQQDTALGDAIANSRNDAEKAGLVSQKVALGDDWEIYGHKLEIEAALDLLASLDDTQSTQLYQDWIKTLHDGASLSAVDLSSALAGLDWTHLSFAPDQDALNGKIIKFGAVEEKLGQDFMITNVSLDFRRYSIHRAALSHPFLTTTSWRFKSGRVLSDGDSLVTSDAEALPNVTSDLILIRNLEVHFATRLPFRMRDALASGALIDLAGLQLGDSVRVYQPSYISSTKAFVFAIAVRHLPKIPNPQPNLQWP